MIENLSGRIIRILYTYADDNDIENEIDSSEIMKNQKEYSIKIKIVNGDHDENLYYLTGKSIMKPEIDDYLDLTPCIKKNEEYQAINYINIVLPTKNEHIKKRLSDDKIFKIDGIGKKTIDKMVDKYSELIWTENSGCNAIEKKVFDKIRIYLKKKNKPNEKQYEDTHQIISFFSDNYEIYLSTKEANKLYIYFCFEKRIKLDKKPFNEKDIYKNIYYLIPFININKLNVLCSKIKLSSEQKEMMNIMINLYKVNSNGSSCVKITDNMKKYITKLLEYENLVVEYDDYLYLYKNFKCEDDIADFLLLHNDKSYGDLFDNNDVIDIKSNLLNNKIVPNDDQINAIINGITKKFSVICGFPGVGKTFVIQKITEICISNEIHVCILAPTAKVVSKIRSDIEKSLEEKNNFVQYYTIHKLIYMLKYKQKNEINDFIDYEEEINNTKVIIIDEMSMVNNNLFLELLKILKNMNVLPNIIISGDTEQLPPIGIGNLFNNIIDSKIFPITNLTKQMRSVGELNNSILKIREGIVPKPHDKYEVFPANSEVHMRFILLEKIKSLLKNKIGFEKIMLIAPTNKTIQLFEKDVKKIINTNITIESNKFSIGDYVMIIKNIYSSGIDKKIDNTSICKNNKEPCGNCKECIILRYNNYNNIDMNGFDLTNGMIGTISSEDNDYYNLKFKNYNKDDYIIVTFSKKYFHMYLKLSYINTIHKYQGSENDYAIILISDNDEYMATRKMLYTAVSRAKNKCIVITNEDNYKKCFKKNDFRCSKLSDMIIKKFEDILPPKTKKTNEVVIVGKKKIPSVLKTHVWNKYIGDEIGKSTCFCCKINIISQRDFICGHIEAEKNGGNTDINNLRPICSSCNLSMGTKNMFEFMKSYNFDIVN